MTHHGTHTKSRKRKLFGDLVRSTISFLLIRVYSYQTRSLVLTMVEPRRQTDADFVGPMPLREGDDHSKGDHTLCAHGHPAECANGGGCMTLHRRMTPRDNLALCDLIIGIYRTKC